MPAAYASGHQASPGRLGCASDETNIACRGCLLTPVVSAPPWHRHAAGCELPVDLPQREAEDLIRPARARVEINVAGEEGALGGDSNVSSHEGTGSLVAVIGKSANGAAEPPEETEHQGVKPLPGRHFVGLTAKWTRRCSSALGGDTDVAPLMVSCCKSSAAFTSPRHLPEIRLMSARLQRAPSSRRHSLGVGAPRDCDMRRCGSP